MTDILLGFSAAGWLFTVLATGYVLWRYVYVPWKVVRADLVALHNALKELRVWVEGEIGQRKAIALSDEAIAKLERNARMRHLTKAVEQEGMFGS